MARRFQSLGYLGAFAGGMAAGLLGVAAHTTRRLNGPVQQAKVNRYTFTPWEVQVPCERVAFATDDGVTLRGWWLPREGAARTIVGCTGHRGVKSDLLGIGTGLWLGKSPAVPVRPWSEDPGVLRLRLDDKLLNPPLQTNRASPRDRSQ